LGKAFHPLTTDSDKVNFKTANLTTMR